MTSAQPDLLEGEESILQAAEKLLQAERQIRERWGGDRPYVAIRPGSGRSERNDRIRRDHGAGERIPLLERRYGLTRSQLHRILATPEG